MVIIFEKPWQSSEVVTDWERVNKREKRKT